MRTRRSRLVVSGASGAFALLAAAAIALAQNPPDLECRKTETQPECHARLKCKADEELKDCQKRLKNAGTGKQDNRPDDRGGGRDNRPDDRAGGDGRRRDDANARGNDRNARGDRGDRDRGSRSRRQRGRGRDGERRNDGKGFQANKTFGLGFELGEPSGLAGKYFLTDSRALDFGVGWIYSHYYYGDGIHLYLDHLWHPASLASTPSLELPFYIGVGARFWSFDECYDRFCDGGSALGLRIPIGISIDFNNAPLDIFFQLTPVIDLLFGDYYDRFNDRGHFGIDGTIGIRFWFK